MAAKKGVVAFDFDGVIGDSAGECFVQSVKAFSEIDKRDMSSKTIKHKFLEGRPLITKVEHLFTVMRLIQENPKIKFNRVTQRQFDTEYQKDTVKAAEFGKRFYFHREQMKKISPKEWVALTKSFPKIAKFIAKVQKTNQVFIATTKDKKSTAELLATYGIKIPESHIIAKEFSKDKKIQIKEIARKAGVQPNKIVLIEDAVKQIKDVKQVGTKSLLVRWGYSTKGQRKQAKKDGIPIIKKANVFGRMKIKKVQRRARK